VGGKREEQAGWIARDLPIYYFHNRDIPLFLMAIYAKNIQTNSPR